jgi:hypothetical protein
MGRMEGLEFQLFMLEIKGCHVLTLKLNEVRME